MKVCALLERGTPPRLNPIFAEVFRRLADRGVGVTLCYPEEELIRLDTLAVDADLYLLKSDTELALSFATALEQLGARVLNPARACAVVKDKIQVAAALAAARIPAPATWMAASLGALTPTPAGAARLAKPVRGYHGVGVALLQPGAAPPAETRAPEPAFAQAYLADARLDLKIYGIGDELFGVRKAFARDSYREAGEPAPLSATVRELAHRVAATFELTLFGLDLAETDHGVQVIDVNYFPGYRGVPGAVERLEAAILRALPA